MFAPMSNSVCLFVCSHDYQKIYGVILVKIWEQHKLILGQDHFIDGDQDAMTSYLISHVYGLL